MTLPLLLGYSLFSVCTFLMCSAGNPGSWSDNVNVSTLNDILKAKGWKKLLKQAQYRDFKSTNGKGMDVSDLLYKEADGNIVTPANYTVKLVKSSIVLSCLYSVSQKFINDMFIEIIAGRCMSLDSDELKLNCMEQFWETMHIKKSLIKKYLVVLNFFHEASKASCTKTVIDALESLLPYYDRQQYNKLNYLDDNGTVNMDKFMRDYTFFLDKVNCANKILQIFLMARCLPKNKKPEGTVDIEEMALETSRDGIDYLIYQYKNNVLLHEESFFIKLGLDKEQFRV